MYNVYISIYRENSSQRGDDDADVFFVLFGPLGCLMLRLISIRLFGFFCIFFFLVKLICPAFSESSLKTWPAVLPFFPLVSF